MKPRHKRFIFVGLALAGVVAAGGLVNKALQSNISYYFSPSQVSADEAPKDEVFRVGGLVRTGTLAHVKNDERPQDPVVEFVVTDNAADVKISYTGLLPDLFKEGQGVVARGRMGTDGVFYAEEVLAKHDEKYMPPEVAATMQGEHDKGVANMQQEATR